MATPVNLLDEDLVVRHFLVKTCYNNRALADSDCRNIMYNTMSAFSDMVLDYMACEDKDSEDKLPEEDYSTLPQSPLYGDVQNVPHAQFMRLLYTVHMGYTWFDDEGTGAQGRVYTNGNNPEYVKEIRAQLHAADIDDGGAFVFETTVPLRFKTNVLLADFILPLTAMDFCRFFKLSSMCDCKYYPESQCVVIVFDTESG